MAFAFHAPAPNPPLDDRAHPRSFAVREARTALRILRCGGKAPQRCGRSIETRRIRVHVHLHVYVHGLWASLVALVIGAVGACCIVTCSACSVPRTSADPGPADTPGVTPRAATRVSDPVGETQPAAVAKRDQSAGPAPSAAAKAMAKVTDTDSAPDAHGWGRAAGLRYLEIVRGGAAADETLPMLLVIHGLGDSPDRKWLRAIDVEPDIKARMILPQAPTPYGRGFAWFEYRFRDRNEAALAAGIRAAAEQLAHMIEHLRKLRPTRGRSVVCGFSQGGMLSYALALLHPELVQFALPISGELPPQLWPSEPARQQPQQGPAPWLPSILALHGTADPVVGFHADEKLMSHLRSLEYPAQLLAFDGVRHGISPAMSARVKSALSAALRDMGQAN